jgi:hypothetical protein
MAVVSVTTLAVKPDGYEEALIELRQIKAFTEKCGGKNVRLVAALVAGQATGSFAFITEADDFGAIGALTDKFIGDPEGQAIFARANSGAGPFVPPVRPRTGWTFRSEPDHRPCEQYRRPPDELSLAEIRIIPARTCRYATPARPARDWRPSSRGGIGFAA